ncbi:MAG: hypothetical protein ACRDQ7_05715 [Haloechinothrix sp.]
MADYATLLRDHVTLTCRSVDRIFLQGYVPKLQSVGLVCNFLRWQRGFPIPSSAAFGKIGDAYVAAVHRFAKDNSIPVVRFAKRESKEAFARPLIDAAAAEGGEGKVVLIGIAQEKASVWRSWPTKGQEKRPHPHMEWGRQMAFVNHFYFYLWDPDWGGAFIKTNAYAPWPIWLWLNGHDWAKRQCERAGIGYEALDNGFRSCEDPRALQRICDRLGSGAVKSFLWRWLRWLPSPFTQDDLRAGYVYELAFRQFEVSDTRVFDRPQAGRAFFEGVIRDHLDVGRPSSVALIFDRRINSRTPGSFRTKVITKGVDPQVCCYYRSSRIKQYFKEHRALRTEVVVSDTRDFGIGRRVNAENWHALRAVGDHANKRLCDAQAADAHPAPDVVTFEEVTRPSQVDGLHAPGLRFGDRRVMAVLAAVVGFAHLVSGFDNRQLTELVATLLDAPYNSRQATYDLRRIRRKGLIERIPHTHRYQLTNLGRRVAVLFTKAHGRVLAPGLAWLEPNLPDDIARRSPLAKAWRQLDRTLDEFIAHGMIAA